MKWVLLIILKTNHIFVGGVYDYPEQCQMQAKHITKIAKGICIKENDNAVKFFIEKNKEKKAYRNRGNREDV